MPGTLLFDLNGTLLDLSVLDPHFTRHFGTPLAREKWFEQLQSLWLADTVIGTFRPFATLADAALQMLAEKEKVDMAAADRRAIVDQLTELPAYPDAAAGLARLMAAGWRLAALTNGSHRSAVAQLKFAGLHGFFGNAVYSVESVSKYKPAPEPYQFAAMKLDTAKPSITMVAAHGWDLSGAHAAGLSTAFLARPRQVLTPGAATPGYVAQDVNDLATQLGVE